MITIREAAAAVEANSKFTLKDAADLARFAAILTIVPTVMLALLGC